MGLIKRLFAKSEPAAAQPSRPPRTQAHDEVFKKYQEAFERAKEEELRKLDDETSKRNRTGSVIIRLDVAVQNSSKVSDPIAAHHDEDAPLAMPKELAEILRSPLLRNAFRTYLKRKYASESLAFFETIELFKKVPQEEWRIQMAEGMVERFINDQAEFAVNISSADRSELVAHFKTRFWPANSFDSVQREMYALMTTNYFGSFCRTYWPGGVLLAVPGGPFSHENLIADRAAGSTASFDELGSNSTTGTEPVHD